VLTTLSAGDHVLPVLYALFVWWASTVGILYLDGLPQRTFKWTMGAATGFLGLALWGLAYSRNDLRVSGAYCAFTCAIIVWAWQELGFLLGLVTGPRRTACPAGSLGWQRVKFALQAIAHHEIALLVLLGLVLAVTWGGSNTVGVWTFGILYTMRLSAKLNIFLGVRNLNSHFLPPHLKYMATYFRQRAMNSLFPISITLTTAWTAALWGAATAPQVSAFDATLYTLCATLSSLAVLEHWLMVVPWPSDLLWSWGLKSHQRASASGAISSSISEPHSTATP
jgi:putative photosynthetic complex assembly protein 2